MSIGTPATVDIILAAILLLLVIVGAVRGLIRSVLTLVGTVFSLVGGAILAEKLSPIVAEWLYPYVKERILDNMNLEKLGITLENKNNLAISTLMPELGSSIRTSLENAAMNVLLGAVRILLFVLFFILCLVLVRLVALLLGKIFELPVLNSFNHIGGAIFGLIEGMLLIYLIVYLVTKLGYTWFTDISEGTVLLNFFLNVSPLEWLDFLKLKGLELVPAS